MQNTFFESLSISFLSPQPWPNLCWFLTKGSDKIHRYNVVITSQNWGKIQVQLNLNGLAFFHDKLYNCFDHILF